MLKINKDPTPAFWEKYVKKHPRDRYPDLDKTEAGKAVRSQLRDHLIMVQHYICAYCCREIDTTSALNEHIKPQGVPKYANLSMKYDNLIASCNSDGINATCSNAKKNRYDECLFVSPLQNKCLEHFRFYPNGEIVGTTEQGKYTIELLNLNSYQLRQARSALFKSIQYYDESYIATQYLTPDQDGKLSRFCDMIQYFYDRHYYEQP